METAYIGLGSNLGDSFKCVLDGWAELGATPGIHLVRLSSPYRTEPVGMISDNWFVNAAGKITTTLQPIELLHRLHQVEELFGRLRDPAATGYQDRTLDFDLLLYGQCILEENTVVVPHPSMLDRLFVMLPLCEIAGNVLHPVTNKRLDELLVILKKSGDNPEVYKAEWPKY